VPQPKKTATRKAARPAARSAKAAHDDEVLAVLAYEFLSVDHPEVADRKIKRRLREKRLGVYQPERVEAIRRFKNALQAELQQGPASAYYTEAHGQYSDPADFDQLRLIDEYAAAHPAVSKASIAGFVPFAVYLYYLR
jgi:hypothetical protein